MSIVGIGTPNPIDDWVSSAMAQARNQHLGTSSPASCSVLPARCLQHMKDDRLRDYFACLQQDSPPTAMLFMRILKPVCETHLEVLKQLVFPYLLQRPIPFGPGGLTLQRFHLQTGPDAIA